MIDKLTALSGALLSFGWIAFSQREFLSQSALILSLILLPLLTGSFYFIGLGIKSMIPKIFPKLKDYATHKGHYGICTHGVRVDGGTEMQGPITYWLKLTFCYPEGAQRFLADNPGAKVTHGERFLSESG